MEELVAARVSEEREARGLSYERLAQLMTGAGCPIHGSAIFKIERGEPRRRITVDELVGFAAAFEMEPSALLREVDEADEAWAAFRRAFVQAVQAESK